MNITSEHISLQEAYNNKYDRYEFANERELDVSAALSLIISRVCHILTDNLVICVNMEKGYLAPTTLSIKIAGHPDSGLSDIWLSIDIRINYEGNKIELADCYKSWGYYAVEGSSDVGINRHPTPEVLVKDTIELINFFCKKVLPSLSARRSAQAQQ